MLSFKKILIYTLASSAILGARASVNGTADIQEPDFGVDASDIQEDATPAPGPDPHPAGITPDIEPLHYNEAEAQAWLKNKAYNLFEKRLSRVEYYQRNWQWIRCRTLLGFRFDMGGSWFGRDAEPLYNELLKYCPIDKWRFKYTNHLGWGDASISFVSPTSGCRPEHIVEGMYQLAKYARDKYKREFYIWDCPGFESYEFWGSERDGLSFPDSTLGYYGGKGSDSEASIGSDARKSSGDSDSSSGAGFAGDDGTGGYGASDA